MLDVMMPALPADATPKQRSAFDEVVEISWYFGGTPTRGPRPPGSESLTALLRRARTASCGW
jgi:hypothetical protein